MTEKQLKTCKFVWDGRWMYIEKQNEFVTLNRVQLKSLSRFIFRVLTGKK